MFLPSSILTMDLSPLETIEEDAVDIKPRSVAFLPNPKIAVIEKKKCTIFHRQTGNPLRVITSDQKLFDIATTKNKTLLAISVNWKNPIIYDAISDKQKSPVAQENSCNVYIAIDQTNSTLLLHDARLIYSYDIINGNNALSKPFDPGKIDRSSIKCHPTKQELIVSTQDKDLMIVALGTNPFVKTLLKADFTCTSADFTPDNDRIIILSKNNFQSNYFVCNLNDEKKPIFAHQLIADNADYASSKSHPLCSMVALLSTDSSIHLFDFITQVLIAKTKPLSSNRTWDIYERKRLDFDETGTSLAVALKDSWKILTVPQNNLVAIFMTLQHLSLPKELVKHIVMNVIDSYKEIYTYLDLAALLNVINIIPTTKTEESIEQNPKKIDIVSQFKRKPNNLEIDDFRFWQGGMAW